MEWPERPPVYADENLDRFLIHALRLRGLDVFSAREAGRLGAADDEQLAYATSLARTLVAHDHRDFRRLHRQWRGGGPPPPGVAAVLPEGPAPAGRVVLPLL